MLSLFTFITLFLNAGDHINALPESFMPVYCSMSADNTPQKVNELNALFKNSIGAGKYTESRIYIGLILESIQNDLNDTADIAESYYLIGVYNLLTGNNNEALKFLKMAESVMVKYNIQGEIYSKTLYNIAVTHSYRGDYKNMLDYSERSLKAEQKIYGESGPELIMSLSNLLTASVELQDYEKSVEYGDRALRILDISGEDVLPDSELADLYYNMGVCYSRLSDFAKAIPYLERTEQIFEKGNLRLDDRFINLLNSMAITYEYMGYIEKSDDYYRKGVRIAENYNSLLANNIINSYAIRVAKNGAIAEGRELLARLLERSRKANGNYSRNYIEVVKNYAEYLRVYCNDYSLSLEYYEECLQYLRINEEDLHLKEPVLTGYSLSLAASGDPHSALEIIQQLLFSESVSPQGDILVNPAPDILKADNKTLDLLRAKYRILWQLYRLSEDPEHLTAAASTSVLIITVLEKVRINLSQEESRFILGDRYRDIYLSAIRDFDLCYRITGSDEYLRKAFEYSEKSKVAGLLASTRELKATQFHIPSPVADLEKELQREISLYNARIVAENSKIEPDPSLIDEWNNELLSLSRKRDSLISLFEKEYPEYYALKYNTQVVQMDEIPGIAGQRWNYVNYIVSDSLLYILIANRRHQQIVSFPIDSGFFTNIISFRDLLISPSRSVNAREEYQQFQNLALDLYNILIKPVEGYLVSNNLLISPDNILSYLPFEALLTESYPGNDILYRELPYLMKEYRISYTYSVTFMSETRRNSYRLRNSLLAFAPVYSGNTVEDSDIRNNGTGEMIFEDLQFARQEAQFVTDLMNGRLYINDAARESTFKSEAGKYNIIHLAMHTVLNDRSPMHSKMIFFTGNDGIEDGLLNTYEVYGLSLNAAMVVLSSCNTGTGSFQSGEGVLSLARGFLYSGSQSVVMTLWEVEDRSGSEIIKEFYSNLRKGKSKTSALRRARMDYLKEASQLGSHPSYWAAQVLYGNNEPITINKSLLFIIFLVIVLAAGVRFIYLRIST